MRKIAIIAGIMILAAAGTTMAQNDPLSASRSQAGKNVTYPTYSTGGYEVVVRNNTSGLIQKTKPDTVISRKFKVKTQTGTTSLTVDTTGTYVNPGRIYVGSSTSAPVIRTGTGTPLYVVKAPVGSIYLRTNGVADSTIYVKSSGTDSAGWRPLN